MADDWIDLLAEPLDVQRAVAFVSDPKAGGIAVFLGTTRTESNQEGRPLLALDYEAYGQMVRPQLAQLAARVREKWPIVKLALLHRVGQVALAEPSVVIAVSTPHRQNAFDACRWVIDTLKTEAAIWKKEIWADGTQSWVQP